MAGAAIVCGCLLAQAALLAQTAAITPPPGSVQGSGTVSVTANPDQAQLVIGVVTEAATAESAAATNASSTSAVIDAIKQVLGNTGSAPTRGYSITPRYAEGARTQRAQHIVGYTATNNLEVTTNDLDLTGKLIDAAASAGANNIGSVSFTLKNPEPLKQQALSLAAKEALAHAEAIAAGLGARIGAVISAQEEVSGLRPVFAAAERIATPIESGEVQVNATVIVTVALQK